MSSSTKTTLNFSIDSTGRLLARRLRVKQALIVAASLTSRLDNASAAAPADLQGLQPTAPLPTAPHPNRPLRS
jgi:hypothetical protein